MAIPDQYDQLVDEVAKLLEAARRQAARSVNAILTATYWEIGRRIVEHEQAGERRAGYGEQLIGRLSRDLTCRFGRGFSADNLERMRLFYQTYPPEKISASVMRKSGNAPVAATKSASPARKFSLEDLAAVFPLSWTHYLQLLRRCDWRQVFTDEIDAPLRDAELAAHIFIWDDFHDRYLITNLIGISVPNGFDVSRNQEDLTTWTRLGRHDRDDVQREFDPAAGRHKLHQPPFTVGLRG